MVWKHDVFLSLPEAYRSFLLLLFYSVPLAASLHLCPIPENKKPTKSTGCRAVGETELGGAVCLSNSG